MIIMHPVLLVKNYIRRELLRCTSNPVPVITNMYDSCPFFLMKEAEIIKVFLFLFRHMICCRKGHYIKVELSGFLKSLIYALHGPELFLAHKKTDIQFFSFQEHVRFISYNSFLLFGYQVRGQKNCIRHGADTSAGSVFGVPAHGISPMIQQQWEIFIRLDARLCRAYRFGSPFLQGGEIHPAPIRRGGVSRRMGAGCGLKHFSRFFPFLPAFFPVHDRIAATLLSRRR